MLYYDPERKGESMKKRYLSEENLERVSQVISKSNFKDLSPENLLTAFQEEGIHSLEDFAKQLTEALKNPKGIPEKLDYETIMSKPTPQELVETIVHQVPQIPFRVNGVLYDPEDIARFNGKELGFVMNNRSKEPELIVLEDKNVWAPFVRMTMLTRQVLSDPVYKPAESGRSTGGPNNLEPASFGGAVIVVGPGGPAPIPVSGAPLWLYEHGEFAGSLLSLDSGESYRDLTDVGWWVFGSDWSDRVSSTSLTSSMCLAFEHVDFGGSMLWLGPHQYYRDLTAVGWNDRISSVINSG